MTSDEQMQMISDEQLEILIDFFNLRFASPGNDFVIGSPVSVLNSDPENPILGDLMVGRTGNDVFLAVDPAADNPGQGELDLFVGGFEETDEQTDGVGTSVNPDEDTFRLGDANKVYYQGLGAEDFAFITDFDPAEDTIQLNGSADDYFLRVINVNSLFDEFSEFSVLETMVEEMEAVVQEMGITTVTALIRSNNQDEIDETSTSLDDPALDIIGIVAGDLNLNLAESYFEFVDTPPSSDPVLPQIEQFGTPGIDFSFGIATSNGGDIAIDSSGDLYQVGGTSRDLAAPNAGGNDVWISKFDEDGDQMFINQFGTSSAETAFSVAVDSNDNFFASGVTTGDLGGTAAGGNDAWVAKFNENGEQQWIEQFGTSDRDNSFGSSLAVDTSDNVIQGGYTLGDLAGSNAGEGPDPWVIKFDNDGNELWRRQFGTPEFDELFGVATDSEDNIFLTGWTIGDLGGTNAGLYDTWIAKYDEDGNQLWTTQFGTSDFDFARGAAIDSEGNFYTTGFTLGDLEGTNEGLYDTWVAKYDTNGNQLWIEQFGSAGSDTPFSIDINDNDEIFIGGVTDGYFPGDNAGGEDAWSAKLDSNGNLLEVVQFGTAEDERALDIATGHNNDIFLSGYTEGSLGASNAGSIDAWLAQLSATDLDLIG
ncbi:SBBP repeat-containing protein [Pleurocapsa sp. PCC 7319]|uniref:SBBP repeat-containing protein n=1 Tax=Pleurocapsa sp. PCC 7319 TaxID=118161 RepID=UPI0003483E67|nr:SBBP repeat-containing protein [Pleurocapsa sp. PCC 7319]